MKYLFVFAHPDDETVACAGTIRQLVDQGNSVELISVTPGEAGEVSKQAQKRLKQFKSVAELRKDELGQAAQSLGISKVHYLPFKDGELTNELVWGDLKTTLINQIESIKPDVVVTFDHTGWYYHLDHVGVSIATTLAYDQSTHKPTALLFSHFQPGGSKWKYVFRAAPATHFVAVSDVAHKLSVLDHHQSQDLETPRSFVQSENPHREIYELVFTTKAGEKLFANHEIFKKIERSTVADM